MRDNVRKRERERECVCVCVCVYAYECVRVCRSVYDERVMGERERYHTWMQIGKRYKTVHARVQV
jgi:hypothetical protein